MGISLLTAVEIATNATDLMITIGKERNEKYSFMIARGPGHNFKVLITSQPFAKTAEEAVTSIEAVLRGVRDATIKALGEPRSLLSEFADPNVPPDQDERLLGDSLIARITEQLRAKQVANTFEAASAST